jgi:RNA polymerase sigma-70 factor (ECF subfamily)
MSISTASGTSLTLLEGVRENDQRAWNRLVHLYGPLVHQWCRRAELNDEDAADVFQETFRAVARNLSNYHPTRSVGAFRSWLRTIVRTKVVDHFRRVQRQPRAQGGTDAHIQLVNAADPLAEDSVEEAAVEHTTVVSRAIDLVRSEFSAQNWQAFEQVVIGQQRAVDVAEQLGVNAQTIYQANYRIRRRLQKVLRDLE